MRILISVIFFFSLFINTFSDLEYISKKDLILNNTKESLLSFFSEEQRDKIKIELPNFRDFHALTGYIPLIKVSGTNIFIDGLLTDYFYMELYNIKIDVEKILNEKKFLPGKDMKIRFHAEVSQKSLNELLYKKRNKIKVKDAKAILKNGHIYLYGNVRAAFLRSNLKSKGSFYVEDEKKVNFRAEYISLERVKLPKFLLIKIVNTMNPVIDLNDNAFDIRLKDIIIKDKKIIFTSFGENFNEKVY